MADYNNDGKTITMKNPNSVPEPEFASDAHKKEKLHFEASDDPSSGLHEGESEKDALQRIFRRVWGEMMPIKAPYDAEIREIQNAYDGVVREAENNNQETKLFPLVFMFVDAKLSIVLSNRPKAVFEHDMEHQKIKFIEWAYDTATEDLGDNLNLDTIDHLWHLYNEIYGWSIKRVWYEVDSEITYEEQAVKDDQGEIVYAPDGYASVEYVRKQYRCGNVTRR